MPHAYTVTFDYRCPFAHHGNASVVAALVAGADHDVRFAAFSLDQSHAGEDEPPVWERPPEARGSGVAALCFGIAVRDHFPDRFLAAHLELFRARHERAANLADDAVLRDAVARAGCDPDAVARLATDDETLATLAAEHTEMTRDWDVFGVPTFIAHGQATFVRLMRHVDPEELERVLDLLAWTDLNEFKRTRLPY